MPRRITSSGRRAEVERGFRKVLLGEEDSGEVKKDARTHVTRSELRDMLMGSEGVLNLSRRENQCPDLGSPIGSQWPCAA